MEREQRVAAREAELQTREANIRAREAELLLSVQRPLGAVTEVIKANDTLRCWIRMIENAAERIYLWFYTFDLDVVGTSLEAARRRNVKVQILGDKTQIKRAKGTQALLARLRTKGIEVKQRDGFALADHYTTGSSATNIAVQQNKGQMHTKLLICDNQMAIGSTNFTTSAQCNLETAAIVTLSAEGRTAMEEQFATDFRDAEDY